MPKPAFDLDLHVWGHESKAIPKPPFSGGFWELFMSTGCHFMGVVLEVDMGTVAKAPIGEMPPPSLGRDVHSVLSELLRDQTSPLAGGASREGERPRVWTSPGTSEHNPSLHVAWTTKAGRGHTHHYMRLTRDEARALARELLLWCAEYKATSNE